MERDSGKERRKENERERVINMETGPMGVREGEGDDKTYEMKERKRLKLEKRKRNDTRNQKKEERKKRR